MLEVATSPAYRDLMHALGKLVDWTEQAGKSGLPSGPPPENLVRQFNEALNAAPGQAGQGVSSVGPEQRVDAAASGEGALSSRQTAAAGGNTPSEVIGASDVFQQDGRIVPPADSEMTVNDRVFAEQRRKAEDMTVAQKINMDRGLEAVDKAVHSQRTDFFDTAHQLSQLLNRPAAEISPMDLLQAQRLVGILKVHAESGRKVSEGVSDTLEQLLEQQG